MYALPERLLLRVSTNSTGPCTSSTSVASPGAPTCSEPSIGMRLMMRAGVALAICTTCSSVKPSAMNLLITQVR
jgi:hypothetical protein